MISGETALNNGDRIELGVNHFFRINCPVERGGLYEHLQIKHVKSMSDFMNAQEEILFSKVVRQYENGSDEIYTNGNPQSSDSIDENSVNLEYAVKKFERSYASNVRGFISSASSFSSLGSILPFYSVLYGTS